MRKPTRPRREKPSNVVDARIEDYMALLNYHHHAMEARRSLELKIFTAGIAFLLVITKGLHDTPTFISARGAPEATLAAFGILLGIYCFMLIRIETATAFDRRQYHRLERCVRRMLPEYAKDQEALDNSGKQETWLQALVRSWAAFPPFVAATVIAIACWLFLFLRAPGNPPVCL
jgi:hypothetical protein